MHQEFSSSRRSSRWRLKRVAQSLFIIFAERGLEHSASAYKRLQAIEYLIGRNFFEQDEQRGASRFHRIPRVFHHLVVQPNVMKFSRYRASSGPYSGAKERVEKE